MSGTPPVSSWVSRPDHGEGNLVEVLAEYLVKQRPFAGGAHLGLAVVVVTLLWGTVSASALVAWAAGIAGASALCYGALRHCAATDGWPLLPFRVAVAAVGVAWGAGAGLLMPQLPEPEQMFLVVALVGLLSGAAMSLLPDPSSFVALTAATGAAFAGTLAGSPLPAETALIITVSSGALGLLALLYRRSHLLLRGYLQSTQQARAATHDAQRQRGMLDAILTQAPSAIALVQQNGCITGVNHAFERLFECSFDTVSGTPLREVVLHAPAEEGPLEELEADVPPREAQRFTTAGRAVPVLMSSGSVGDGTEHVRVVVYEDLSSVVEARYAIVRTREEYRQLVEASPDLVWRIDTELRWTFVNKAAQSLYGMQPEHLLGRSMIDRVPLERKERDRVTLTAVLRGAEVVDYETVHLDLRGEVRHLSMSMRPVVDDGGDVIGAQGVARDVTHIIEGVVDLERARADAEQYAQSRSAFLANVSHEIRTPLNGLLGMTEVLLDSDLDYEQRRSMDLVKTSAESLLSILNDVLDYSKIEAGGLTLEAVPVEVTALVDSVVRVQAVPAFERKLEIAYDIRPEVPPVIVGDPGRLRQVLSNLVANAVKFTEEGEIVVTAECLERTKEEVTLRVAVRDTGVGIPADRLEAIFHDYVQRDETTARAFGGTGLGLAIARRLVRMMGGDIEVSSTEGEGSTFAFTVRVPIEDNTHRTTGRTKIVLIDKRVVLVGSNGTSRSIVADQLRRVGMEVMEAADARSATGCLEKEDGVAIAIIDAHLSGGLDGFGLAEWIRESAPDVRVMMLTAAGQRGDAQRCRELGITAYLTKPVSRSELLEAVASVVSDRASEGNAGRDSLITRYSIAETRERLRVLYVEDNVVNQTVASSMLKKRGHDVTLVDSGEAAIEIIETSEFDVVLMDIQLPGISGVDLLPRFRASPGGREVPIVAVTAMAMPEQQDRFRRVGFDAYLAKPFRSYELFAAVEGWDIAREDQAEAASDTVAPVAWDELLESMREAGIAEVVPAIVDVFIQDAPIRMEALREAVDAGDAAAIESAAHAFKSAAGTVRAKHLAGILHQLEQLGRADELDGVPGLLEEATAAFKLVDAFLRTAQVTG